MTSPRPCNLVRRLAARTGRDWPTHKARDRHKRRKKGRKR